MKVDELIYELAGHNPSMNVRVSIYNVLDEMGEPQVIYVDLDSIEVEGGDIFLSGSLEGEY